MQKFSLSFSFRPVWLENKEIFLYGTVMQSVISCRRAVHKAMCTWLANRGWLFSPFLISFAVEQFAFWFNIFVSYSEQKAHLNNGVGRKMPWLLFKGVFGKKRKRKKKNSAVFHIEKRARFAAGNFFTSSRRPATNMMMLAKIDKEVEIGLHNLRYLHSYTRRNMHE